MMEYIYLLMGSYTNDPEYEVIFGAYKTCEAAREAKERLTWDKAVYAVYIWKEKIHE